MLSHAYLIRPDGFDLGRYSEETMHALRKLISGIICRGIYKLR